MLIFPSHSNVHYSVRIQSELFINEIRSVAIGFDSVVVCMYYKDILNGNYRPYEDAGFYIVTAGHYLDLNFVRRLKSVILLSDFTMSNEIGTNLGFCVCLNKPHYVFRQTVSRFFENKKNVEVTESTYRNEEERNTLNDACNEIYAAFGIMTSEITPLQLQVVDKYWGLSSIRNKETLLQLLKNKTER